jgi:hypothetical protein
MALSGAASHAQIAGYTAPGVPSALISPNPGIHVGRFDFHAGANANVYYDDLVDISPTGVPQSDVVWSLSPFFAVETEGPNSRKLRLTYSPSFIFFTDHTDLNTINHYGSFRIDWPFNRLTLMLGEDITIATGIIRDVGNRATIISYSTRASASYQLSDVVSLDGSFSFVPAEYGAPSYGGIGFGSTIPINYPANSQLINSQQYNEQISMNYQVSSKLRTGVGISFTQTEVDQQPGQLGIGPFALASYNPDPHFTLSASAGFQTLQFDSGAPSVISPTFALSVAYKPQSDMTLTLSGSRSETPSAVTAGQNYSSTTFAGTLTRAFRHRINASLGGGYTLADYYATEPGVQTHRTDNYYFVTTSVNWTMTDRWNLGLYYQHSGNGSTAQSFVYDQNTVGLQLSWSF